MLHHAALPRPTDWRTSKPSNCGDPDTAACCPLPEFALPGTILSFGTFDKVKLYKARYHIKCNGRTASIFGPQAYGSSFLVTFKI